MSRRNILNKWLWKQAENLADDPEFKVQTANLGASAMPHLRRDRVTAAYVFHGELGGWIGDVHLKGMPRGFGNVLGISVAHPHNNEAEARQTIIGILAHIIRAERSEHHESNGAPVFAYQGSLLTLHDNILAEMEKRIEVCEEQYEYSMGRLADMEELLRGTTLPRKFDSLEPEMKATFVTILHMARHQGIHALA